MDMRFLLYLSSPSIYFSQGSVSAGLYGPQLVLQNQCPVWNPDLKLRSIINTWSGGWCLNRCTVRKNKWFCYPVPVTTWVFISSFISLNFYLCFHYFQLIAEIIFFILWQSYHTSSEMSGLNCCQFLFMFSLSYLLFIDWKKRILQCLSRICCQFSCVTKVS